MFKNAEFTRNTWTEMTPKRLLAMPLLVITLYFLVFSLTDNFRFSVMPKLCIFLYAIFTYIWGTRLAAESVVKEINANTWPSQVMTSMSPLKMAIGKLFGSTVYIWYGNLFCLALYVFSYKIHSDKLIPLSNAELYSNVLIFILLGLIAHIMPLLVSLHSIRWRHFFEQFDLTFFQLTGVLALLPLRLILNKTGANAVMWFGEFYSFKCLVIIFSAIFIVWGFIAIVNQIKAEFGQEPYPVPWFLFSLTLAAILFGFNNNYSDVPPVRYIGSFAALFAVLCLTYLTVCGESNMALRPHMVLKYLKAKQYKRLFMIMPRSLVTIPIILGIAIILSCQLSSMDTDSSKSFICLVWAVIMFMLRDFSFIYLWSLFAQGNEKETTVVPVLIALATYTVIPAILFKLKFKALYTFFTPYFHDNDAASFNELAVLTVAPATIEFLIMLALLIYGIRKKVKELNVAGEI